MASLCDIIKDLLKLCEVKAGERVVLYTGQEYDNTLLQEYINALKSMEADFLRVIAPARARNQKVINTGGGPLARGLFKHTDMVIYVLPPDAYWKEGIPRVAQLHTPEFKEVSEENPTLRWLQVGVPYPEINYRRLFPDKEMVNRTIAGAKLLTEANEIRLTSKLGTDFTCRKDGKKADYNIGYVTREHTWDNFGLGTVVTNPIQDSAQGTLVVAPGDHWHHTNSPEDLNIVREPIKLTFKEGLINNIEGGVEAKLIKKAFEKYCNDLVYRIAHIGWGTNKKGVWVDNRLFNVADWESTYGSIMIHFGGYTGVGGVHLSGPTVIDHDLYLDGRPVIVNNKIVNHECN
jgi:2,5-dihydroxypyridine 5,6-dioxygenase